MYFTNFETVPATGRYRIKIRATGVDRDVYDEEETGTYHGDPIRLSVHLGDRVRTFELPDNEVMVIELDEWIMAGTKIQLSYPTGWTAAKGNGNFKFQYAIASRPFQETRPETFSQSPGRRSRKRDNAGTLESLDECVGRGLGLAFSVRKWKGRSMKAGRRNDRLLC